MKAPIAAAGRISQIASRPCEANTEALITTASD